MRDTTSVNVYASVLLGQFTLFEIVISLLMVQSELKHIRESMI